MLMIRDIIFDNGYDNNKKNNYDNYEDDLDFVIFCMQNSWNVNLTLIVLLVIYSNSSMPGDTVY